MSKEYKGTSSWLGLQSRPLETSRNFGKLLEILSHSFLLGGDGILCLHESLPVILQGDRMPSSEPDAALVLMDAKWFHCQPV